ncbi:hypothetical protein EDC94DRAFT_694920 [Helicostylum pulchrum]|uniref:ADF-H domain-containing protein n=1 Tax=Helicostylum pulchrum TaxID=562976 RepID=A0ABP9Y8V3_9FUNG|nr:hypothetical protein EDC94DRAFT_694920 [Helicostylum pulchrum]
MCDLSDPRILETYTSIVEEEPTNWLILGYNDTRDVISLYSKGSEGLNEFRNNLRDEVLYGFVRVDDRFILITWVSEQVSGVRRARALVHSRSVAAILKLHNAQLTASTTNDLSDANIRTRLKLGDSQIPRRSTSTSQKRASRRQSVQSPTSPTTAMPQTPTSPTTTSMPQSEFVDANESLPSVVTQETLDDQNKLQQQQLEAEAAAAKEQDELNRKKEEDRAVAAAVAAERESKRIAAEREVAAKKAEEDKIQREQMEQVRVQEEKKLFQQRIMEAEKNKDVVLSGYVSVQPHTSPFWRRRYFTIKGKSMAFFRDELQTTPVIVLDLKSVIRLNSVNVDIETFVPNAFVLETEQNGSYQFFADDKKGLQTILTALQTVI